MYNRDFSGIRSDGQLFNMQQEEYEKERFSHRDENRPDLPPPQNESCAPEPQKKQKGLFGSDIFSGLKTDDLLLIGVALLLLSDSDGSNDLTVLLILFLLLS